MIIRNQISFDDYNIDASSLILYILINASDEESSQKKLLQA